MPGEPVPSKQNTHNLDNKLRTTGSLLDKKVTQEIWCADNRNWILVLDLKLTKKISYKWLAQETSVSKTSAQKAIKLLKIMTLLDNRLLFVGNLKVKVYKNKSPHSGKT